MLELLLLAWLLPAGTLLTMTSALPDTLLKLRTRQT